MEGTLAAAILAVPSTLFTVTGMAGVTNGVTGGNPDAIRRTLYVTGGLLLATAIVSNNTGVVISTSIALAASTYITFVLWKERIAQ